MVEAGLAHVPVLAVLHAACFPQKPWGDVALTETLRMPGAFGLLALGADSEPVGFILGWSAAGTSEILAIGVLPAFRRGGAGRALLSAAVARAGRAGAGELFLEVAEDNSSALALYRESGFVEAGRRQGYYEPATAALVLKRPV